MHAIDTEYEVSTEPVPRLVSVAIAGTSGCGLLHQSDPAAPHAVREVLRSGAVFAMAPADVSVMWRRWPALLPDILDAYEDDRVVDVLTCEKLLDIASGEVGPQLGYGLAAVAERRAGITLDKGADTYRLRYGELLDTPIAQWPTEAREYALLDAAATFAIWCRQRQHAALLVDAHRQARAHLALHMASLRGIRTDPTQVARVDAMLSAEIERLTTECLQHGLARVGGTRKAPRIVLSETAAATMLEQYCSATGQAVPRTEPTARALERGDYDGNVSLAEKALNALHIAEGHPLFAYRKLGALRSMRTGWVPPLSHPYVYTRYADLVESGRTSSSGYDRKRKPPHHLAACSRNLQNFPKPIKMEKLGLADADIRGCLVARPGYTFLISDYSALELITLAQVQLDWCAGRSALADVLRDPKRGDPHGEFGADMLGIPYAQFDKNIPACKQARQGAKAFNFGKPGGMGSRRFIAHAREEYGVELTEDQERQFTAAWHRKFPEMQMFFDEVKRRYQDRSGRFTVTSPRSGRVRGDLGFPDACNTHFQGLGSDIAKHALWQLFRAALEPGPLTGCWTVLFVHDEVVTEAPIERATEALAEQERLMIAAAAHWCPDVPIRVESSISPRYNK